MSESGTPRADELRDVVERYLLACGSGQAGPVRETLARDACLYDLNMGPIRGADAIAEYWADFARGWERVTWRLDSFVATGDVAGAEWTMDGRRAQGTEPVLVSGAEFYAFDTARIAQIRQYWRPARSGQDSRLQGFSYR